MPFLLNFIQSLAQICLQKRPVLLYFDFFKIKTRQKSILIEP